MLARKFLHWRNPAFPAVVEFLISRYATDTELDLDQVLIVVPGRRAGRRLLEILVQQCAQRGLTLSPPIIDTVGNLPERLYESKRPMASQVVQYLAWVHALRSMGKRRVQRYIPQLPDDDDVARWLAIGKLLWDQHRELAAEGMDFESVIEHTGRAERRPERQRWRFLADVQKKYLRVLDHHGLWDRQTARLYAIQHRECKIDRDVLFVATADMNRAVRQMISQIAERVTVLIHAPVEMESRFDEFGCIIPEEWENVPLDVPDESIHLVTGTVDQAQEVVRLIAEHPEPLRPDEITVGVPDERIVPQLQRQFEQSGAACRWAVGRSVADTATYRLLSAIANYIDRQRFRDFAALLRHPDIDRYLVSRGLPNDWLNDVDRYYEDHLPPTVGEWLADEEQDGPVSIVQAHAELEDLLRPLQVNGKKLGEWTPVIWEVLTRVYEGQLLNRDQADGHYTIEACRHIQQVLIEHENAPAEITPRCGASQAVRLVLEQLRSAEIPALPDDDAVELVGWLELPLDTAPMLIVTSMNDGFVPKSLNSDLFLPNALRRRLNLLDNSQRYARDAYALSVILASRPDAKLIVAQRDSQQDPLSPSRLLLATPRSQLASRSLRLFGDADVVPLTTNLEPGDEAAAPLAASEFYVPLPKKLARPVSWMNVTAFRTYLACPYRFYLRHVLNLQPRDDGSEELTAPAFGILVHDVLKAFGNSEWRDCGRAQDIRTYLRQTLDELVAERFGKELLAAVSVQLQQMRVRLDAFADWQAGRFNSGWQIRFIECPDKSQPFEIQVEEGSVQVYGRIDRIDQHVETGEWAILDYKTGDQAKTPHQTHFRSGEWIDLQLPLYRRLAMQLGVSAMPQLGYILLPKDLGKVGVSVADWSPAQLQAADELAASVVRRVLSEEFWPPAKVPANAFAEYGAICQDRVFERRLEPVAEEVDA